VQSRYGAGFHCGRILLRPRPTQGVGRADWIDPHFVGRDVRAGVDKPRWLKTLPEYAKWIDDEYAKKADGHNHASVLYNGMINPLIPYAIKGAIWYQGESNAAGRISTAHCSRR